ncbi:MAG: hypothetical protein ACKV2T_33270 [Kofleriaceae bacterium]
MQLRLWPIIVIGLLLMATPADAYPQFQLALGTDRCSACHWSPAGGGVLGDLGRDEASSLALLGGDGRFLHGVATPPDWLSVGGDFRFASGVKQLHDQDREVLAFPMQADLYGRATVGPISVNLTVGLNGSARGRTAGIGLLSYVVSRQHYLEYRSEEQTLNVRAGRFFPVFGSRTQDHTAYSRRYLDQGVLQEPYAVEVGLSRGAWDVFAAGFIGNPVAFTGTGPFASGATAYVERVFDVSSLAINARYAQTTEDYRVIAGAVGKHWLATPGIMLIGELAVGRQSFAGPGDARVQLLAYAQATKLVLPGFMFGATIQRWSPDLFLSAASRNAFQLDVQTFPYAHVELHLLLRAEATGGDTTTPNLVGLFQLHYFL